MWIYFLRLNYHFNFFSNLLSYYTIPPSAPWVQLSPVGLAAVQQQNTKKSVQNISDYKEGRKPDMSLSTSVSCRMQRAGRRPARPSQPGNTLYSLTQTGRSTTSPWRATQSKTAHEFPLMWVQRPCVLFMSLFLLHILLNYFKVVHTNPSYPFHISPFNFISC